MVRLSDVAGWGTTVWSTWSSPHRPFRNESRGLQVTGAHRAPFSHQTAQQNGGFAAWEKWRNQIKTSEPASTTEPSLRMMVSTRPVFFFFCVGWLVVFLPAGLRWKCDLSRLRCTIFFLLLFFSTGRLTVRVTLLMGCFYRYHSIHIERERKNNINEIFFINRWSPFLCDYSKLL